MMNDNKPLAFVLVPGGYCLPTMFDKLEERLLRLGHIVQAVHLPTVGRAFHEAHGHPASMYDDAAHVGTTIGTLSDAGHDVVAVGSSYGGFVITEAAKGLTEAERATAGKPGPGGLVGLVYLASAAAEVGTTLGQLLAGKIPVPVSEHFEEDFLEPPPADMAGKILCSELESAEEQSRYGAMMDVFSSRIYRDALTHAGWRTVPSTFVLGTMDKALGVAIAEEHVDAAMAVLEAEGRGKMIKKTVLESDHLMMISQPDRVVEILIVAAKHGQLGRNV